MDEDQQRATCSIILVVILMNLTPSRKGSPEALPTRTIPLSKSMPTLHGLPRSRR